MVPVKLSDATHTYKPSLVVCCGKYPSLHDNLYLQPVFAKINLKTKYPFLYKRLTRDHKNANKELSIRAIESFNWEKSFESKSKTILNVCHNFIPNKFITCINTNSPWFNNEKFRRYLRKNKMFRQYINIGKSHPKY